MHHAYVYEGLLAEFETLTADVRERLGFGESADPDVHLIKVERFGIGEARELRGSAAFKSVKGRALFVIGVSSMTTEAQQALLKLFEEPQEGAVFVLLVPQGTLIATLRSRFIPYPRISTSDVEIRHRMSKFVKRFLALSLNDRSKEVADILKKEEGQKENVRELLLGLEEGLRPHLKKQEVRRALEDVVKIRSYVNDRSASLKMLLEHLALSLPTVK